MTQTPIDWRPSELVRPPNMVDVPTAWDEMELGLQCIVNEFCYKRDVAVEFGVQHGYSAVAISNYFHSLVGVDTFVGDPYAGEHENIYQQVKAALAPFPNIDLVESDWASWAEKFNSCQFDLIHVDIYHVYDETYRCGLWSAEHSPCVLFHDTISFPAVKEAVSDLAKYTGKTFYHWPHRHGLGILV